MSLLRARRCTTAAHAGRHLPGHRRRRPRDEPALDDGTGVLTYDELAEAADELADELNAHGVGPRRQGRGPDQLAAPPTSTSRSWASSLAGAAYVPVDVDDPDERARLVFDEADVGRDRRQRPDGRGAPSRAARRGSRRARPGRRRVGDLHLRLDRHAEGRGGHPPQRGRVRRRRVAAVPPGRAARRRRPGDGRPVRRLRRQLRGDVARLAVRRAAWCRRRAPWSAAASTSGRWLVANDVTVVSTVPTLVALWPTESLADVRLLIMGGEACPPELAARLVAPGREVWNTYGPTEATVVACGAELDRRRARCGSGCRSTAGTSRSSTPTGSRSREGATGELIIGGVGLARYLDPAKDAEKYAAMPTLGWDARLPQRRPGRQRPGGAALRRPRRRPGQARRPPHRARRDRRGAARRPGRRRRGGRRAQDRRRQPAARRLRRHRRDASTRRSAVELLRARRCRPRWCRGWRWSTPCPTRTSGKVDRDALPWPLPSPEAARPSAALDGTAAWIAELWLDVLGADVRTPADDFFDLGGGSLTAAQMVSRLRDRYPEVAVGDIYEHPTVGALAGYLDELGRQPARPRTGPCRRPRSRRRSARSSPTLLLRALAGPRWLIWVGDRLPLLAERCSAATLAAAGTVVAAGRRLAGVRHAAGPDAPGRGRGPAAAARRRRPATTRAAARSTCGCGWPSAGRRARCHRPGRRAVDDLVRPAARRRGRPRRRPAQRPAGDRAAAARQGLLDRAGGRPQRLLGRRRRRAPRRGPGRRPRPGRRPQHALPGADVGADAEVAPGSAVFGVVPEGEFWSGSPADAGRRDAARGPWSERPAQQPRLGRRRTARWRCSLSLAPGPRASLAGGGPAAAARPTTPTVVRRPGRRCLAWLPVSALLGWWSSPWRCSSGPWCGVRRLAIRPGVHPVRSGAGAGGVDDGAGARRGPHLAVPALLLELTPTWLRLLGARIGKDVEASTVLMIPTLTQVNDQAFLADDTLIGGYELGGGWLRVERVKIGKRAFVGNSGMAAPGRKVPEGVAGRRAVGRAAPQDRAGGRVLAGQPAGPAAAGRRRPATPAAPTPRRPGSRSPAPLVEVCRLVPVAVRRRARRRRGGRARRAARPGRRLLVALVARRPAAGARRRWSPRWSRWPPSGCSSAGCGRAPTRCGARSSGATSWPTRSSRCWPRRGSRGRSPAPRCSTCGSG